MYVQFVRRVSVPRADKEMWRYGCSIPGGSEKRWSSCGKLMIALKEAVLYSGVDKGENHERGVDLIVLKDAAKVC